MRFGRLLGVLSSHGKGVFHSHRLLYHIVRIVSFSITHSRSSRLRSPTLHTYPLTWVQRHRILGLRMFEQFSSCSGRGTQLADRRSTTPDPPLTLFNDAVSRRSEDSEVVRGVRVVCGVDPNLLLDLSYSITYVSVVAHRT